MTTGLRMDPEMCSPLRGRCPYTLFFESERLVRCRWKTGPTSGPQESKEDPCTSSASRQLLLLCPSPQLLRLELPRNPLRLRPPPSGTSESPRRRTSNPMALSRADGSTPPRVTRVTSTRSRSTRVRELSLAPPIPISP